MLSASASASYVRETWHKNTNKSGTRNKKAERGSWCYTESLCVFLCCAGIPQAVQTPHSSLHPLRAHRGASGKYRRSGPGSYSKHWLLVTLKLVWRQNRPLFVDKPSADTGVFNGYFRWAFILYQWQIRLLGALCRLSARLIGLNPDRCKKFSTRAENFHHLAPCESAPRQTWQRWPQLGCGLVTDNTYAGIPLHNGAHCYSGDSPSGLTSSGLRFLLCKNIYIEIKKMLTKKYRSQTIFFEKKKWFQVDVCVIKVSAPW